MNLPSEILKISQALQTQDNRSTSHPIVQVRKMDHDLQEEITLSGATFFTVAAAEAYILANQHRHKEPLYTFIDSGWRNPEWQAVRDFLISLTNNPDTGA